MSRKNILKVLLAASIISTLIQAPFLFMLNLGVHSRIGGFGYLFYYPWIRFLDHFATQASWRWENHLPIFEAALFVLQSLILISLVGGVLLVARSERAIE
jgi:hypothetical protein